MDAIGSVNSAQAAQSAQDAAAAQVKQLGLPPVNLSAAASTNTLNAALVTSQFGVDPGLVGGVYGGAAQDGGLFASDYLLPVLTNLTHANAEQALSLLGISTPKPSATSAPASADAAAAAANATPAANQLATDQASNPSGAMTVDPLWGRSA